MAKIHVSIEIPRPPEVVWADVEQLETHAEWMADAVRIDFDGDRRRGVGTTMKVLTKLGPLRTIDVLRVLSWEPPHTIGVRHEGLVSGTGEFRLHAIANGTRFHWIEDLVMPWYFGGRVVALAAKPILAALWRRNLKRLAARFE
jgi:carbon monoxide dehydrogenase subunit G